MKERNRYLRTDMAAECCTDPETASESHGLHLREYRVDGVSVSRLEVTTEEGEAILSKPMGVYITLDVGRVWLLEDEAFERVAGAVAHELGMLVRSKVEKPTDILVAGLGNRFITSDAIGPLTVEGLTVTRHIKAMDPSLFEKLRTLPIAAVAPGVVGQTGIETADLIRSAVEAASPSVLLCVDALAARSVERLAVTVQLSDSGIAPGSGIGNHRRAINEELLGIPVIAIGVPTVVDSSTMVYGMLEKAGVTDISEGLEAELQNGRSFFVTLKDADTASGEMARLVARAIHLAFSLP